MKLILQTVYFLTDLISGPPPLTKKKLVMPDSQQYHCNLYLISTVEDNVGFLARKVINSDYVSRDFLQ